MTIASEIYRSYCECNTIKYIDDKDNFLNECEKRAISESYDSDYAVTTYSFSDGSCITYCSTNDYVGQYGSSN